MTETRVYKHIITGMKAIIGGSLMLWLLLSGRIDLSDIFDKTALWLHLSGLFLVIFSQGLQVWRWQVLLNACHIPVKYLTALRITWIASFFGIFLPGLAGTEMVRGIYIWQGTDPYRQRALFSLIMDKSMGLYIYLFLGLCAFLMLFFQTVALPAGIESMGFFIFGIFLFMSFCWAALIGRIRLQRIVAMIPARYVKKLIRVPAASIPLRAPALAVTAGQSLMSCVFMIAAFRTGSEIIGEPASWVSVCICCPLIFTAAILPFSPGGLGVAETSSAFLFASFGYKNGATLMLLIRCWILISRLPGGILFLLPAPASKKQLMSPGSSHEN